MVVVSINHNHNENVKNHKTGFSPYVDFMAIDSGSKLEEHQKSYFDIELPNVYYSGLINAAFEYFHDRSDDFIIYFIASDVVIDDYLKSIERVKFAFSHSDIAVYAPCANESPHKQMVSGYGEGLRQVNFVEGFCFAVRLGMLRKMCPIDIKVNKIGWGLDVYLGYLAMKQGLKSVVDYEIEVFHPTSSGYDIAKARNQRDNWFNGLEKAARVFRKWATFTPINSNIGIFLLKQWIKRISIISIISTTILITMK
ncbi:hypothetical protein [Ekhidna sp.]